MCHQDHLGLDVSWGEMGLICCLRIETAASAFPGIFISNKTSNPEFQLTWVRSFQCGDQVSSPPYHLGSTEKLWIQRKLAGV